MIVMLIVGVVYVSEMRIVWSLSVFGVCVCIFCKNLHMQIVMLCSTYFFVTCFLCVVFVDFIVISLNFCCFFLFKYNCKHTCIMHGVIKILYLLILKRLL